MYVQVISTSLLSQLCVQIRGNATRAALHAYSVADPMLKIGTCCIIFPSGATVQRMRPVSITNPDHFVNVARRKAAEEPNSVFADQFENLANFRAHRETGHELWQQCEGHLHGFVCGAGTGGTIAGVSTYLKEQQPDVQVYLVDPPGSSLYNKVTQSKRQIPDPARKSGSCLLAQPWQSCSSAVAIS